MTAMLKGLPAEIVVSLFSYIINSFILDRIEDRTADIHIPLIEEFYRTYFCICMDGNLIFSHMLPDRYFYTASILSLVSRALFGVLTFYLIKLTGLPLPEGVESVETAVCC